MKKLSTFLVLLSIVVISNAQEPITRAVNFPDMDLFSFPDTFNINQTDLNGLKQGYWKIKAAKPNGTWYVKEEGVFFNDLRSGFWKEYYETGVPKTKMFYAEGKVNGAVESYYGDGSIHIRSNYKKGRYVGKFYRYYKNGIMASESEYSDEGKKINGTYFFETGTIKSKMVRDSIEFGFNAFGICEWVFHYKDGKRNGYSYQYDKKGYLTMKMHYENNKRNGKFFLYHTNGNIKMYGNYKEERMSGERMYYGEDGKPIKGKFSFYNSEGKLEREGFCVGGKPEGLVTVYYDSGLPNMIVEHKNGKVHGKALYYNKNGTVSSEETYKDGEFVELKSFEYIK